MKKKARHPSQGSRQARFGVYLDRDTRKQLLKAAIDEDIPATKLVEKLIRDYLARRAKGKAGKD